MGFRFTHSVKVEGRRFAAGDRVAADELPSGCRESLLRVGHVVPDVAAIAASELAAEPDAAAEETGEKPRRKK